MKSRTVVLASSAVLVLAGSGCGGDKNDGSVSSAPSDTTSTPSSTTSAPAATTPSTATTAGTGTTKAPGRRYSLAATRRCLEHAGLLVGPIDKSDPRLRALGDLAQRTSIVARSDNRKIGIAFGDAELLAELLAVPNDLYTIETRGNVVLLYRPSARSQASAVRSCLR